MTENIKPDIDINSIGTGCATGCGAGCLQAIVVMLLITASGIQLARIRPESIPVSVKFISFLIGLGIDVLVGYVTAQKAPHSKMLHAIIVGVLTLVFGIMGVAFNPKIHAGNPLNVLGLLLFIPMVILGAKWAISREEQK